MKTKGIDVRNVHTCARTGRKFYQVVISYCSVSRVKRIYL